jgi:hypothetical protein
MTAFNFSSTSPTGRKLGEKRVGRRTEIRGHKVEDAVWERNDKTVFVGEIRSGRTATPPAVYDEDGVRVG